MADHFARLLRIIEKEEKRLQERRDAAKLQAIAQVNKTIAEFDITAEELTFKKKRVRKVSTKKTAEATPATQAAKPTKPRAKKAAQPVA